MKNLPFSDKDLLDVLIVAVLIIVFLIGQHSLYLERENQRLHEQVDASTVPPSTEYVKTR